MTERLGTGIREQLSNAANVGFDSPVPTANDRMLELEAENARLKSLVAELLVTNQVLRESRDRGSIRSYRPERADT